MISDVYDLYTMISKQCSKNRSKHAGAFINPNGVWTHSHNSHGVANLVYLQISGSNFNWWYVFLWSNRLKYWPLFTPLLLVFFGNDVCQLLFCCLGPYSHDIGIDFQLFYVLMLLEMNKLILSILSGACFLGLQCNFLKFFVEVFWDWMIGLLY